MTRRRSKVRPVLASVAFYGRKPVKFITTRSRGDLTIWDSDTRLVLTIRRCRITPVQPRMTPASRKRKPALRCKDGGTCGVGGYCDNCPARAAKKPARRTAKEVLDLLVVQTSWGQWCYRAGNDVPMGMSKKQTRAVTEFMTAAKRITPGRTKGGRAR